MSPLPAGTPRRRRRRRLPGGGTCEHRAEDETVLSPGLRAVAAAGPPRPRQRWRSHGSQGSPAAPPHPAPQDTWCRRSGGVSRSQPSPAARSSCPASPIAAPTGSPATSRAPRPAPRAPPLPSPARPTAGRLRLIRGIPSPDVSPILFGT